MRLRRVVIFSRVSRCSGRMLPARGAEGAGATDGAVGAGAGALSASTTSGLLMTPPMPVPLTVDRSTPDSAASRWAAGDARREPSG